MDGSIVIQTNFSFSETLNVLARGSVDFKAGQRVYINGSLVTNSFQLADGKTRGQILVRAERTILLDDPTESGDINQVDIVANVCRSATRMRNDTVVFQVATHFERM